MENPLFRNYWNAPRPRFSTIPVRQQQQQPKPSHPPKIVSIPVRFVESEKTRSEAATKIQMHFRGFAVQKNVKKIAKIRSEVVEIERRISQKETKELIARDAKERLRLNETLMSLLFRLDSVRGIDSAVRDCRKAAIRRAIALQEAVDAITEKQETQAATDLGDSSGISETAPDSVDEAERAPEMQDFVAPGEQTSEIQHHARISDDCGKPSVEVDDRAQETEFPSEFRDYQDRECVQDPSESAAIDDCGNPSADDDQAQEMVQEDQSGFVAAISDCRNPSVAVDEQALAIETADKSKEEKSSADGLVSVAEEEESQVEEGGEEEGRERNEKEKPRLRSMVTELRERNEEQGRMIGALWERVEQLERTVESMRRRKKKRHHAEAIGRRKCERRLWL